MKRSVNSATPDMIDVECDRVTSARLHWLKMHLVTHGYATAVVCRHSQTVMRVQVEDDISAVLSFLQQLEGLAIPIPSNRR